MRNNFCENRGRLSSIAKARTLALKASYMSKSKTCVLLLVTLIVANLFYLVYFFQNQPPETPSGRIIFQRGDNLSLVDGDGNHVQFLGGVAGFSPTWSKDGMHIAIGCYDTNKICILDANTIPDWRSFPQKQLPFAPNTVQEIELPEACKLNDERAGTIQSLSWSPDSENLVLVCNVGSYPHDFSVCIVPLSGKSKCWDEELGDGVRYVVWSPTEDVLAISGGADAHGIDSEIATSNIYLVTPNGKRLAFLSEGWNPEWAPDGSQIAFFKWGDHKNYPGIGIISPDGSDFSWIYESPQKIDGPHENDALFFGCSEIASYGCRLAWSPDGQYLVFAANQNMTMTTLLRLDLKTGELIYLIPPMGDRYSEPDWGP